MLLEYFVGVVGWLVWRERGEEESLSTRGLSPRLWTVERSDDLPSEIRVLVQGLA